MQIGVLAVHHLRDVYKRQPLYGVNFMRRLRPDVFLISAIIDGITVVYSGNLEIYVNVRSR